MIESEQNRLDQIADIDRIESALAAAQATDFALAEVFYDLGQQGAIARTVNEAGTEHDHRHFKFAIVPQSQPLGLHFRLGVAIYVLVGQGLALIGAVVIASRVNAQAAQMDEALQHRALASIQKGAQALDIDRRILFDGPPIAD